MKDEGAEETKRLSVKMPVSTLLNSRRVWSPAIWPEERRESRRGQMIKGLMRRKGNAFTPLQHAFTLCHANPINANSQVKVKTDKKVDKWIKRHKYSYFNFCEKVLQFHSQIQCVFIKIHIIIGIYDPKIESVKLNTN